MSNVETAKPVLKIIGVDGNAFVLLAHAQRAARKAGWTREKTSAVMKEAMSGNYDHLLATLTEHFDVE